MGDRGQSGFVLSRTAGCWHPIVLAVLQHDPFERIAHVFAAVDRFFDVVVEFLPLHDFKRVDAAVEQVGDGRVVVVVADAFQAVNLDQLSLSSESFGSCAADGRPRSAPSSPAPARRVCLMNAGSIVLT